MIAFEDGPSMTTLIGFQITVFFPLPEKYTLWRYASFIRHRVFALLYEHTKRGKSSGSTCIEEQAAKAFLASKEKFNFCELYGNEL